METARKKGHNLLALLRQDPDAAASRPVLPVATGNPPYPRFLRQPGPSHAAWERGIDAQGECASSRHSSREPGVHARGGIAAQHAPTGPGYSAQLSLWRGATTLHNVMQVYFVRHGTGRSAGFIIEYDGRWRCLQSFSYLLCFELKQKVIVLFRLFR